MSDTDVAMDSYEFPLRTTSGVLLGLSGPRVAVLATAGALLVTGMAVGGRVLLAILPALLVAAVVATVRVGGRVVIEWLPIWVGFGLARLTGRDTFRADPALDLGDGPLDLPGELWGIELQAVDGDVTSANPTATSLGVVVDVTNRRRVAIAEVSAGDFLFLDDDERQQRVSSWGVVLDHLAQAIPELTRIQVVHEVGPESVEALARHHHANGGHGPPAAAESYRQLLDTSGVTAQSHRLLVAIALDVRAARRHIRQTGGGDTGAAAVLLDRAAQVEDILRRSGLVVHGWLPARRIAEVLRVAYDPLARLDFDDRPDDTTDGGGVDPAAAGPTALEDEWLRVRHDTGWSTTLQVVRPPSRPVTGDFLQHLQVGVGAERRMSLLYVPQATVRAERAVQAQQVANASDQQLRAKWGFSSSARQQREMTDARRREEDVAAGRAVLHVVWLITITGVTVDELEAGVGQVEAAARRCALELRRMAGQQRQAAAWTVPLCRGAR